MEKLLAVFRSRRFWVALASAVATVVFREGIGLSEEEANRLVALVVTWILGDALRETK